MYVLYGHTYKPLQVKKAYNIIIKLKKQPRQRLIYLP